MTDLLIRVHTNGVECDKVDGTRCQYRDNRSCWLFWQKERGILGDQPVELEGEGPFLRCKECLAAEESFDGRLSAASLLGF